MVGSDGSMDDGCWQAMDPASKAEGYPAAQTSYQVKSVGFKGSNRDRDGKFVFLVYMYKYAVYI